jgi:L-amino acid N-acyltransferase YncA
MIHIETMQPNYWQEVRSIYEEGIRTGNATFESTAPEWEVWDQSHLKECRIIARKGDKVLGWAALSPVSGRCVYAGVAEVSVYVSADARGKGIGKLLLEKLIDESEAANLWTLQAGIFPENVASVKLHEAYGFRNMGRWERIGKMNGVWRDTIIMEHRSKIIGND